MTEPPPELEALAEATDRAQAFLAEVRHQLGPGAPAGVVCMILMCEADSANHLGEPLYGAALIATATRLANDWQAFTIAAQQN